MDMAGPISLEDYNSVLLKAVEWLAGHEVIQMGPYPSLLYHFTDVTGLIGILKQQTMWFSMATSLNDASELEYGLALSREVIKNREEISAGLKTSLLANLRYSKTLELLELQAIPFIASFCGNINMSNQWLHYGRGGKGIAIAVDPEKLIVPSLRLARVIYDLEFQTTLVLDLLAQVETLTKIVVRKDAPESARNDIVAVVFSGLMHMLAATYKDPSFKEENEWRGLVYPIRSDGRKQDKVPTIFPLKYRNVDSRCVPYVEMAEDGNIVKSIKQIVLGYSSPMKETDPALRLLLNHVGISPELFCSNVPVR